MDDQNYESIAKQKIMYLKQTYSLVPFQDDDFIFLDQDIGKSLIEQSVFVQIPAANKKDNQQQQQQQKSKQAAILKVERKCSLDQILKEYDTMEETQDRLKLLDSQFNDAKVWINFQLVENYQNQLNSMDWKNLLDSKNFAFRKDKNLYESIRLSVSMGLNEVTKDARKSAWLLMLGIDEESQEYLAHKEIYQIFLEQKCEPKTQQASIENLLLKDVQRTFANLKLFNQPPASGKNKLFNILKAYSLYDTDVGYSQGMSFIAALVLMIIEDEALAWTVFLKLLNTCEWRHLYLDQTPKLFELTKNIRGYIKQTMPRLHDLLNQHNVILEPLFASPFLTLFSNLVPIDLALKIIDRFILFGERGILDIMKHLIKQFEDMILKMDCWDIQVHLGRKIYELSVENNTFFPPYSYQ